MTAQQMGSCPACGYRVPVRKDGTPSRHRDRRCDCGDPGHWCEGSGPRLKTVRWKP